MDPNVYYHVYKQIQSPTVNIQLIFRNQTLCKIIDLPAIIAS